MTTGNESDRILALYEALLGAWNRREAGEYAELFAEDASVVGFDGSQMSGRAEVASAIDEIFRDHVTAAYVWKVRGVRFLKAEVAVLVSAAGMVPPGKTAINPATNAIQILVAEKISGIWRVASFQNTPAVFHGRPELGDELTNELNEVLRRTR